MLNVDLQGKIYNVADGSTLEAIKQIKFKLDPESFTCIVGPSGCGKTTTLRAILGLDKDYKGSISFDGQQQSNVRIGTVFQEPRLLPWRSVEDNIRLTLPDELQNIQIDDLLNELDIQHVRHFFPSELSLGLARRVSLARAYAIEPALLILDEPFVSLDENTAIRLRVLLAKLCKSRPTTTLMVTHNLNEAALLADRIIVLSERPSVIIEDVNIDLAQQERSEQTIAQTVNYIQTVQKT